MAKVRRALPPILFVLLTVLCYAAQQTSGLFEIGGVRPILLVPILSAFALKSRRPTIACITALLFGFAWDFAAQRPFGYYGLMLFCGCIALVVIFDRLNARNSHYILATVVLTSVLCLADVLFFHLLYGYSAVFSTLSSHTIPTIFYTAIVSLLFLKLSDVIMLLDRENNLE